MYADNILHGDYNMETIINGYKSYNNRLIMKGITLIDLLIIDLPSLTRIHCYGSCRWNHFLMGFVVLYSKSLQ